MRRVAAITLAIPVAITMAGMAPANAAGARSSGTSFEVREATIAKIHSAYLAGHLTATQLVEQYLSRIAAYNGTCVSQPEGVLGRTETLASAGQLNALLTLNLRPARRAAWGFDARKARTLTDAADDEPDKPDALEEAARLDREFVRTRRFAGPLHGIPIVIKDQFDTVDMRTTSGADVDYANDRPPRDSTVVARLRAAGAIILGKGNMGEYAGGDRSSFGGPQCNPYDTERSAGRSSGGAAAAVAANLTVCAIGEESGPSIRNPARNNNVVGLAPTQELVSRAGMIPATLFNDRVGPICRTVADVARVLDVISGYDSRDPPTAFSVGRVPAGGYSSLLSKPTLRGVRIGVVREYMQKSAFTRADHENIDVVDRDLAALSGAGAVLVDPGPDGALFSRCAPTGFSLRDFKLAKIPGEGGFVLNEYLRARGDAHVGSIADLIEHSRFFTDVRPLSGYSDKRALLQEKASAALGSAAERLQKRQELQQVVLACMAELKLDALVYPTSNIAPPKLGAPVEPEINGRSPLAWSLLGAYGFAAITVPAGFTTQVFDRVPDDGAAGSRLVGPVDARLPVGIDFLTRPFDEPLLLQIAAAYEKLRPHREPPAGF